MAQLLADAMFQRVFDVTNAGPQDPYQAIQQDDGLKAIINAGLGSAPAVRYVLYATDRRARSARRWSTARRRWSGPRSPSSRISRALVDGGAIEQLNAVYHERRFEVREPILAGDKPFGAIRVGISTLLVANEIRDRPPPRRLDRADRAGPLHFRRDAARAMDAAADSRDPERPEPAGSWRAGRRARSARATSFAISGPRSKRSARSSPPFGHRSCRRPPPTSSR